MSLASAKLHKVLLVVAALWAVPALAQTTVAPPAPPTDKEILSAQITYYALLISRLQSEATEREKAWAEYSKPLWQQPTTVGEAK